MASNLTLPYTGSFNTVNIILAVDDGITADFLQDLAQNTGFNHIGFTNSPRVCRGRKASVNTTDGLDFTVDFGLNKTDGVDDFTNTDYQVLLTMTYVDVAPIGTNDADVQMYVTDKQTGQITVEFRRSAGVARAVDVDWLVIGQ